MTDPTLPLDVAKSGLDAVKPMTEAASEIFVNLFGEPSKALGDHWAQKMRLKQEANLESFRRKVKGAISLEKEALEGPADLNFAVQLFEAVSKVDDSDLQEMWARLLVSSVKREKHRHPAYIPILSQLSVPECLLLQELLKIYLECRRDRSSYQSRFETMWLAFSAVEKVRNWHYTNFGEAFDNLIRLGLVSDDFVPVNPLQRPPQTDSTIRPYCISGFGIEFTSACCGLSAP